MRLVRWFIASLVSSALLGTLCGGMAAVGGVYRRSTTETLYGWDAFTYVFMWTSALTASVIVFSVIIFALIHWVLKDD